MESTILRHIPSKENTVSQLLNASSEQIMGVCNKRKWDIEEFKAYVTKKLSESNMHLEASAMALNFLFHSILEENSERTMQMEVYENILGAGIYYANVINSDPVYHSLFVGGGK